MLCEKGGIEKKPSFLGKARKETKVCERRGKRGGREQTLDIVLFGKGEKGSTVLGKKGEGKGVLFFLIRGGTAFLFPLEKKGREGRSKE